jgi:hypothetical protein
MTAQALSTSDFLPEDGHVPPVAQTLRAVALEVKDLALLTDRLQTLIGVALVFDGSTHADHMREFQAIDLLVQRLQGVAIFMQSLSDLVPLGWRLSVGEAAARVPLTDLARRLSGLPDPPSHTDANAGADDGYELFA